MLLCLIIVYEHLVDGFSMIISVIKSRIHDSGMKETHKLYLWNMKAICICIAIELLTASSWLSMTDASRRHFWSIWKIIIGFFFNFFFFIWMHLQDMHDMRNCYDSLLSTAAATASSAYGKMFCAILSYLLAMPNTCCMVLFQPKRTGSFWRNNMIRFFIKNVSISTMYLWLLLLCSDLLMWNPYKSIGT